MAPVIARRRAVLHRIAQWLTGAYLVVIVLIAFWPSPVDREAHESVLWVIDWLQNLGAPAWFGYATVEFAANVTLFVPVGLLVVILVGPGRWWLGIVIGFFASCAIELAQYLFLPARFATTSDVIANTTGAVIGTLLALLVLRIVVSWPRRAP